MEESYVSWASTLNVLAAIVLASLLVAANYANLTWFGFDPLAGLLQQKRQAHGGTAPEAHKDTNALAHQVEAMCQSSCRKRKGDRPPRSSACAGLNTETPASTDALTLELSPRTPPQEHHPVHHNCQQGLLHQGCALPHTPPAAAAHFLMPPTPATCTVHTQTSEELLQQLLQLKSGKRAEGARAASHEEPEGIVNTHTLKPNSSSSSCSKCGATGIAHAYPHHAAAPAKNGWQDTHTSHFKLHSGEHGKASGASGGPHGVRSKRSSSGSSSSSSSKSRPASPSPAVQGAAQGWAHIHTPVFNAAPWDDDEEGAEGGSADEDHVLHTRPATTPLLPRATPSSFRDASPCRPGYCYHDLSGGRSKGGRPITRPRNIKLDLSRSPKAINLDPSHSPGPPIAEQGCEGLSAGDPSERGGASSLRGRSRSVQRVHGCVYQGRNLPREESNRTDSNRAESNCAESNRTESSKMAGGATGAQLQERGEERQEVVGSGCESVSVNVRGSGSNGGDWRSRRSSSDSTSLKSQPPHNAQQQWQQLQQQRRRQHQQRQQQQQWQQRQQQEQQQLVGPRSEDERGRGGRELTGAEEGVRRQSITEEAATSGEVGAMGFHGASRQHEVGVPDAEGEGCSAATAAGAAALLPAESPPPPPAAPPGTAEGDGSGVHALFSDEAQLLREVQVEATELQARLKRLETDHQQLLLQLSAQLGIQPSPLATPEAPSRPTPAPGPCDPQPLTFSLDCNDALDVSSGGI
ncbi:hypothetical protein DUNSADRAFT_3151 [Dunaliella salina]|uniref:Uncharacterized protein n=1 Tax=Dunaliella salina TaxID=3046 RepID=A0ABQ7H843_DUNSA|nr:hypothetical protein DUNSADRAFT_3151 [Dunaliella salina]|eukprot:KAF5843022.1 hypothetical protein DUNSADRAFT_3151 [Dunaliella salina]